MSRALLAGWIGLLLALCGCSGPTPAVVAAAPKPAATSTPPTAPTGPRTVRANGVIQAVRAFTIQVPRIEGSQQQGNQGRLTLVKLVQNGAQVKEGDVLAEFDRTPQMEAAREAQAKYEDLAHQVRQKAAENLSEAEKRALELKQAEADVGKAEIQLKKGPILADIERWKNEEKARGARLQVESLKKIDADKRIAEAAALKILELQTQRQKVALDRANRNAEKLVIKASISGMVALENIWRNGSMGPAQEGDQLWPGQVMFKIFDPAAMEVRALISEPDRASLQPGVVAMVHLDAYPDAVFKAHFQSASPVATSAMGSPVKNFAAVFRLEQSDPRLLPDLSAAVIVRAEEKL